MARHEALPVGHVLKHGEERVGDRTLGTRVAFSTAVIAVLTALGTLGANPPSSPCTAIAPWSFSPDVSAAAPGKGFSACGGRRR